MTFLYYIFIAIAIFYIITVVLCPFYFKLGWFKFFYHDILGWHVPDDSEQWSDGCSQHAKCRHCGREIMQDSQGNWFC